MCGALLLAGCAAVPRMPEAGPGAAQIASCRSLYERIDRQIQAAGVRDAGSTRIPGFAYLRSDRYAASFADALGAGQDERLFADWVGYLRENEDEARAAELSNLGLVDAQAQWVALRDCAALLSLHDLQDPAVRKALVDRARPANDYSIWARAFGLYPLAAPFLRLGVRAYQRGVQQDYDRALDATPATSALVLWSPSRPAPVAPPLDLESLPRDRLGRPQLSHAQVEQLAQQHAPAFWIETGGDFDRPGAPRRGPLGPDVDVTQPVVHFKTGLTRFAGRSLLQISYFLWFSERPAQWPGDPEAGALDGIIWRVTLDEAGRVLLHDTIHSCGCYHFGFPLPPLQARSTRIDGDAMLLPQDSVPSGPVAVRLQSGTHAVRRVVALDQAAASQQEHYALRRYEDLLRLPQAGGGTRSLFGEDGLVAGSERRERYWLWPSGVRSAGAMRQWGRHATAFVGTRHFDDPFMLDERFEPLAATTETRAKP